MTRVVEVSSLEPDRRALTEAADVVSSGGVIAYPTETVYGLGVDATDGEAVRRLFRLKGRKENNPILILVKDFSMLRSVVADVPERARKGIEKFWPGPVTMVFDAAAALAPGISAGTGRVGVRISSHPMASALMALLDRPLTSTSANPAKKDPAMDGAGVVRYFDGKIDLLLDGGVLPASEPSTVIDVARSPVLLLRKGAIAVSELEDAFGEVRISSRLTPSHLQ